MYTEPSTPHRAKQSALRSRAVLWLTSLLGRRQFEAEMEEEIRFHLDARTEELTAAGVPSAEAARQARLEFGGPESHKDGMRSARGLRHVDDLSADLTYALRLFRKSPGFTAIAVSSLALAIGANTTIFSAAHQILYARLNVPHPQELRQLMPEADSPSVIHDTWGSNWLTGTGRMRYNMLNYPVYVQLQQQQRSLGELFAFNDVYGLNVTVNGEARPARAELVSGDFYSVIGVRPQLGRAVLPADDRLGGPTVAVISDGFWHRALGGSAAVLGRTLNVNGSLVTIVGVNPPGFTGAGGVLSSPELFLPISMIDLLQQGFDKTSFLRSNAEWWVQVMARAKPGVPDATAAAELSTLLEAAVRGTMPVNKGEHIPKMVLMDASRGNIQEPAEGMRSPLFVLLGMVGLVLLLACANIANLLLARASTRSREMSVRMALGAGKSRVLRQVLTESLLLSALGGVLGLLLGYLARNVVPSLLQPGWQKNDLNVPFSWPVFAFTAGITIATGLLFGVLPAWRSTRQDINASLKQAVSTASRRRGAWSSKAIVSFQIALSTLLVIASALFVRTLLNLNRIDTGFHVPGLVQFSINAPSQRYADAKSLQLHTRIEEAVAALPGVQEVALTRMPFLAGSAMMSGFQFDDLPGHPVTLGGSDVNSSLAEVDNHFLHLMGVPILRGRAFGPEDTATSLKVALVNEAFARQLLHGADPIGRSFHMGQGKDLTRYTIVGVCADTLYNDMRKPPAPLYLTSSRQTDSMLGATYMVRTSLSAEQMLPMLRRTVAAIDPDLPVLDVQSFREAINANLRQERLFASLTAGFGLLAVLLACVGVYGVMAYTVAQRTNEIGIRLALGAPRLRVRGMVLREALWLGLAGVGVGLCAALLLRKLVESMLYGIHSNDAFSLSGGAALLLAVALLACWIPAAKASRVEPVTALRHE